MRTFLDGSNLFSFRGIILCKVLIYACMFHTIDDVNYLTKKNETLLYILRNSL